MNKISKKRAILFFLFFIIANCSRIKPSTSEVNEFYSKDFLERINQVKNIYKKGQWEEALRQLQTINSQDLEIEEKLLAKNLMGVIFFSVNDLNKAIENFNEALTLTSHNQSLISHIHLNLGSTYYKKGDLPNSVKSHSLVDLGVLKNEEKRKYYFLDYQFKKNENDPKKIIRSLNSYLSTFNQFDEVKSSPLAKDLQNYYFQLNPDERDELVFKNYDKSIVIAYLALLEAQKYFEEGNVNKSTELLDWIDRNFPEKNEILFQGQELKDKLKQSAKIDSQSLGIVLPLSGDKKRYAEQTILGIDSAININGQSKTINLQIRDSMGNGVTGAFAVKELIEKHAVPIIIGGLFSDEAEKEYLEAKKNNVFFISLSPIYLASEEKDYLLLEIPGSVESQTKKVFSKEILEKFGKRLAILVSDDERGEAYLREAWKQANLDGAEVVNVQKYAKDATDFREPIKNLLGLTFTRERQEELDFLKQISALEGKQKAKESEILPPIIDFEWVYIPGFPTEAQYIIPIFRYYDAVSLKFMGGPSWRSKSLSRAGQNEKLFFVGNDLNNSITEFRKQYFSKNKQWPGLIEVMAFEALTVARGILKDKVFATRYDFIKQLKSQESIVGPEASWKFDNGLWVKDLSLFRYFKNKIDAISNLDEPLGRVQKTTNI